MLGILLNDVVFFVWMVIDLLVLMFFRLCEYMRIVLCLRRFLILRFSESEKEEIYFNIDVSYYIKCKCIKLFY